MAALIASFERAGKQWNVFLRKTPREISKTGLALVFSPGSGESELLWPVGTALLKDLLPSSADSVLARIQQELDFALESSRGQPSEAGGSPPATGRSA